MTDRCQPSDLCGIVLAAGEGKRLQTLVRRWRGDDLPKQYVQFTENRSLLQQTIDRARRLIPSNRLFTVVDRKHLTYTEVWRQIETRPSGTVILQPENKETGPGVLLPLMRVYKYHPNSTVAIFPSDHFIRQENLFIDHVDLACRLVAEDPSRLILLGMQPTGPDPEYGYILPGGEIGPLSPSGAMEAIRFIEKPEPRAALELVRQGGLWNTMVMVVKTKRLLELARAVAPELLCSFDALLDAIGTPDEGEAAQAIYKKIPSINFSKDLLERFPVQDPSSLAVLPVRGVYWSDWGSVQRVVNDLRTMGQLSPLHPIEEDESLLVGQSRSSHDRKPIDPVRSKPPFVISI